MRINTSPTRSHVRRSRFVYGIFVLQDQESQVEQVNNEHLQLSRTARIHSADSLLQV